jgi:MSHA biogenesis protein MshP
MSYNLHTQRGFSLPVAIFIIVIMALLAAAAVNILNKGLAGVSQEVMSTRAFYSAESGAQFVLSQLFPINGGAANCAANSSVNFNNIGLSNCRATMTCNSTIVGSETFYSISSTGTCSTGDTTTVRQIQVMARQQ